MLISLFAAVASISMYLAYRRNVIAGPLVALVTIPAVTASAISLSLGEWKLSSDLLARFGADFLLILIAGIILIWLKQKLVHKRDAMR